MHHDWYFCLFFVAFSFHICPRRKEKKMNQKRYLYSGVVSLKFASWLGCASQYYPAYSINFSKYCSLKVNCFSGCFLRETVQTANKKTLWYSWQYFSVIIIINILFLLFFRKKLCKICQSCLKKKRLRYSTIINYTNFSHKLLDIKRAIVLGSELFKIMQCLFCCGLFVHKEGLIDRPNFYNLRVHLVVIWEVIVANT